MKRKKRVIEYESGMFGAGHQIGKVEVVQAPRRR
jgi:hypothetical protein